MDPSQRLANFDANYGFGYDAAGRPVNNNEFSLGQGNFARQATMAERQRLEQMANQYDGGGLIAGDGGGGATGLAGAAGAFFATTPLPKRTSRPVPMNSAR